MRYNQAQRARCKGRESYSGAPTKGTKHPGSTPSPWLQAKGFPFFDLQCPAIVSPVTRGPGTRFSSQRSVTNVKHPQRHPAVRDGLHSSLCSISLGFFFSPPRGWPHFDNKNTFPRRNICWHFSEWLLQSQWCQQGTDRPAKTPGIEDTCTTLLQVTTKRKYTWPCFKFKV